MSLVTMSETLLLPAHDGARRCTPLPNGRAREGRGARGRKCATWREIGQQRALNDGGSDGTRTRDLRLDRPALASRKYPAMGDLRQSRSVTMPWIDRSGCTLLHAGAPREGVARGTVEYLSRIVGLF